jgi:hypothetical protein
MQKRKLELDLRTAIRKIESLEAELRKTVYRRDKMGRKGGCEQT